VFCLCTRRSNPPQLDYAPPTRWHERSLIRRLFLATSLGIAGLFAIYLSRGMLERVRVEAIYRRCASDSRPASTTVFSASIIRGAARLNEVPAAWTELNLANSVSVASAGTVFLHEMRKADGTRRLVGVDIIGYGQSPSGDSLSFLPQYRVYTPASAWLAPRQIAAASGRAPLLPTNGGDALQLFAGQFDPQDPSHFTVNYAIDGKPGIIDGWLKDDDTIVLEPRPIPATLP